MYKSTRGLVLRETNYRESDKILTVLTEDEGKITVSARGARKKSSKISAAAQLFAFSEMTIHQHKDRFYLNEGRTVELFTGLRRDIRRLATASYFAELLETVSDEDIQNPDILSLGLNALYLLSMGDKSEDFIKAVFELRLMCLSGYEPVLSRCAVCGEEPETPQLDMNGGYIFCQSCKSGEEGSFAPLCGGSVAAMRYIADSKAERIFSFSIGDDAASRLFDAAEGYVQCQLGRGFRTLDFLKGMD